MVHDYLRAAHRLPIESSITIFIHVSVTRPHIAETLTPEEGVYGDTIALCAAASPRAVHRLILASTISLRQR
jgi:hypothetical protein